VRETSGRLLALLGLLQTPRTWPAVDLAARLGVGERTVRKDVERLRALDYPIDTIRGPRGGYRLGDQGKLPPLLLDDEEAVAIAVGLQAVTAVRGIEESSALALAKLEHVLPSRLRRRVRALHESTSTGPADTATNVAAPPVDPGLLTELAVAVRDNVGIRFRYRGGRAVPTGELAAAVVRGGAGAAHPGLAQLPRRLDAAQGARRRALLAGSVPGRRLHRVRAA
jgi:predicted DNA-binding transcriptional regulator YafY